MYSQCPDCLTRFRVTAEVLRVAQGTVRCGRCGSAFNALARLSDTPPPAAHRTPDSPRVASPAPQGDDPRTSHTSEFHFSVDDLDKVFVQERDWQRKYGPTGATGVTPDSFNPTNDPSQLLVDEGEPLEDITLEGERIQIEVPPGFLDDDDDTPDRVVEAFAQEPSSDLDSTDRFKALDHGAIAQVADEVAEPSPSVELPWTKPTGTHDDGTVNFKITSDLRAQLAAAAGHTVAKAPPPTPAPTPARERIVPEPVVRPVESIAPRRWQPPSRASDDELLPLGRGSGETADESESGRRSLLWTLGCLVLVLALAAQLTHYFRQDLVRHPQIGPILSRVYEQLGLDLAPNWDPRAFEIRQWGDAGHTAKDGRMSVQASIRNTAAFAQPYPLLRLELEDRFGGTVATRDFVPAEYLKAPVQATRMLASGGSADADLQIVDPGEDAVGYRLNVCLRESAEILRCAQGPG